MRISDWSSDVCSSDLHRPHLAVIDHGERVLHAVEELDQSDQAGHHVNVVGDVSLVGRDDGKAERGAEAGGEAQQPDKGEHQGGKETLTLLHEAQQNENGRASWRKECVRTCRSRWWPSD